MTLGVGIIGCGRAGVELHCPAIERVDGATVVALADTDPGKLSGISALTGTVSCHTDHRALLEASDVDIALVATPPPEHAAIVRDCLERGKHVMVEKPLAATPEEARELVQLAEGTQGVTAVGHNLRCHRLLTEARELLRSGVIGAVESARSLWSSDIALHSELPDWRMSRRTLGGVIHEMGIHHLDLWRFLLGQEIETVAALSRPGTRDDDSTALACRMSGGTPVTLLLSQRGPVRLEFEVLGTTGRLRVDGYRFDGLEIEAPGASHDSLGTRVTNLGRAFLRTPAALAVARRGGDFIDTYRIEWDRMLTAVRDGVAPICSFEDGYRSVVATHAAADSALTGEIVKLPRVGEENNP